MNNKAFTLIELVAVLIVLAMLMIIIFKMPLELIDLSREINRDTRLYRDSLNIRNSIMQDLSASTTPAILEDGQEGKNLIIDQEVYYNEDERDTYRISYSTDKGGLWRKEVRISKRRKDQGIEETSKEIEDMQIARREGLKIGQDPREELFIVESSDQALYLKFNKSFSSLRGGDQLE